MANDRLRVPIDDPYLHALGLATVCFARLEWNAVWCGEKIQPGYIRTVRKKTAGQIATDILRMAAGHPNPAIVLSLGAAAADFKALVGRRNDLVHANPGTAKSGEQRLFRNGAEWTIDTINNLSDEFVVVGGVLNNHFHNLL